MLYSLYIAAILALLLIGLSLNISRLRMRHQVAFGDGGKPDLIKAVRAHGNSLEQSMLFIVLLYLGEATGQIGGPLTAALGFAFIMLRLLYCTGLFARILLLRQASHALTMLVLLAVTLLLLIPH
ncbi:MULTISPECIES: MAPEG family protein [unclassified Pseudomonas]|uniref:MAPEG family protein n=1 Tax=unclassified Pseudomonas TaxID=196821 RepID=UPI00244C09EE|nr:MULTISPECIES: MAPEG family protein [unclassified Pseudomonas]MDG9923669.1 MAPEG family protein [Pseudomonas sp. GD04045]MDH0036431.1 MAPEG family protein [Pseudomonas sp. GD04019]